MTRRFLLQGVLLSLLSRVARAIAGVTKPTAVGAEQPPTRLDDAAPGTTTLSPAETDDLLSLGEIVVEGRALSPAERGYLAEHIADPIGRPADQLDVYRTAARLLDRLAGQRFSDLSFAARNALVRRYRLDARVMLPGRDPVSSPSEAFLVRARVVPDLVRAYWSSPAGWAAVRYASYPGRCGDLLRYTRSEP